MDINLKKMSQLYLKFPFKKNYLKKDFYVSSNNLEAYRLIESYPDWPDKKINIYGPKGCGKTHLANILNEKMRVFIFKGKIISEILINSLDKIDCLIIDNFEKFTDEDFFYSLINLLEQQNKYLIINSSKPIQHYKTSLKDLASRLDGFISIGIDLPNEELLRVIISKTFSEKQIEINNRNLEYIVKNIDRSYEKISKFINDVDNESLSSGKMINIKLIKKILNDE